MSGVRRPAIVVAAVQQVTRGRIRPDHVDLGAAVGRVLVVDELVLRVVNSLSLPYQSTSPSRMALGTRLLGMNEG